MAVRVRLFAALRDAAGTSAAEVAAGPLPQLLAELQARYGERFAAVLAISTVLVDGDAVPRSSTIDVLDGAEVALLPPVSGGAGASAASRLQRRPAVRLEVTPGGVVASVLLLLGVAGLVVGGWLWTLALVTVAAAAAIDLTVLLARSGTRPVVPALLVPVVVVPVALDDGGWGEAAAWIALTLLLAFALVIVFGRRRRVVEGLGATGVIALLTGLGTAGLTTLHGALDGIAGVTVFAVAAVLADVAALAVRAAGRRNTAAALAALAATVLTGVVAGALAVVDWIAAAAVVGAVAVASPMAHALLIVLRDEAGAPTRRQRRGPDPRLRLRARRVGGVLLSAVDTVLLAAPLAAVALHALR